ncbi:SsgA family sporulation/cell division regulator [Streptomyces sp. PKU-EA00015]|uniref:SsgA family sporulation/cell division regulator n=1 Tax=Streptomyces sp. PKU-EA00015 TaxID=2748326 RepID=UPI0015A10E92|nr:SsgA family sporulation/cell division regulator [Streptomyces sp. PKU-EA00015]NWF24953.1 SsgA family sporulation/cell division regulator [Streptomyces sp. PKU-EA00015]
MPTVIEQAVQARLVAPAPRMESVLATLHYDRRDPFAVRIDFPAPATLEGADISWAFSRELLAEGVRAATGIGDVRVRPYGYDRTVLEFHAAEGTAVVHIRTGELLRFLDRAQALVPAGSEHLHLDLDDDLAELLGDAR